MSIVITTVNVNGIRAAVRQRNERNAGMLRWLSEAPSDVIVLQEIRASHKQAHEALAPVLEGGWHLTMTESSVKGHAGVGVLSRIEPAAVRTGFGSAEFDDLGRYVEADFGAPGIDGVGELTVGALYLPKGAADTPPDAAKFEEKKRFLDEFGAYLAGLIDPDGRVQDGGARDRGVVVGGDWNIAPAEADIKNWKGNLTSPGFLPHERAWVAGLLASGWSDVVRDLHPEGPGPYSWWSWRGKAFDNDAGWRIDYQLANAPMAAAARSAVVDRADAYDLRWSDHAPVTVTFG
ncbi:exodeoxyribonuclease III [Gordonia sp. (in: high G+C Gram-positive bacteria)]|uniref:exodeoxyribonuclease III n=1 Tax=Gordonia sp. (in: high G+C Gram-positive bacteria) TaxID=84139 RepID=UPI0019A027AF|nr:exodeoxyribonuclease III [Gordonia sp. (in: high G+C Gram-positive bacteria)]MBD0020354.1 endonuclease/exonuclease/phosphatase family protein [Gordonia sp. (in: high G+C Gram-positive bacteria)]